MHHYIRASAGRNVFLSTMSCLFYGKVQNEDHVSKETVHIIFIDMKWKLSNFENLRMELRMDVQSKSNQRSFI